MTQSEIHRHLVDARNRIDRVGWSNGNGVGRCAANAISDVVREPGRGCWSEAHEAFADAIGVPSGYARSVGIFDWNDAPGRTVDEVLDAFDRAIAQTAPPPPDVPLPDPAALVA